MTQRGREWAEGFLRKDAALSVNWLPLTLVPATGARIGILGSGDWVLETAAGLATLTSEGMIGLLPLLESAREEVEKSFASAKIQADAAGIPAVPFLLDDVVLYGLKAGDFWANHALSWISSSTMNESSRARFQETLQKLASDRAVTQATRHDAMRKLSMIRKSG